jgi:tetratricopeptide (TPR) repeat protein
MADWLDALEGYDNCIRINQQDASSYYEKAKINFILKRTREAVDCLKSAFGIDPGFKNEFEKEYPDIKSSKLFKKLLGEF